MEMSEPTKKIVDSNVESTATAAESRNKAKADEASVNSISLDMEHTNGNKTKAEKTNEKASSLPKKRVGTSRDIFHNMKYSFFKHVGFVGLGIIIFQASLCGWYIYIIYEYTMFQNFGREWIWLFITMGVLFFLTMIYSLVRWKRIAAYYTAQETGVRRRRDEKNASVSIVVKLQTIAAMRIGRGKKSIFGHDVCTRVAISQEKTLPKSFKKAVVVYFSIYGVSMFIFGIGQLALLQGNHDDCVSSLGNYNNEQNIWKEGCTLKTPYCNTLLVPKCDCAVLNLINHNLTQVPKVVLKHMKNMRFILMNHGPLKSLPTSFNDHSLTRINRIDFSYNRIGQVPGGLLNGLKVTSLKFANNRLINLPGAIWSHAHMISLDLDNNFINEIHHDIANAQNMQTLLLSNNSVTTLPKELGDTNLIWITLDGNNLSSIPEHMLNLHGTLYTLLVQNQNITSLPEHFGRLTKLGVLDLRNNSISSLPDSVKHLHKMEYLYLYANPICTNGWMEIAPKEVKNMVKKYEGEEKQAGCVKQCSPYCQNRLLERSICLRECNSKECEYNKGSCTL
eukprot:g4282.t1